MKKWIIMSIMCLMQMATDGQAAYIYIYDASGTVQKYNRYFLPPTQCWIDDTEVTPIRVGEFIKIRADSRRIKHTVLCKAARALDVKKEIRIKNSNVYLELRVSRYKRSTLEQVISLPENFGADYVEAQ